MSLPIAIDKVGITVVDAPSEVKVKITEVIARSRRLLKISMWISYSLTFRKAIVEDDLTQQDTGCHSHIRAC